MHNITVWASQDNTSYSKIIEFDNVSETTKQANITDYIKNSHVWIEFRFFGSSSGTSVPRIFDFSINTGLNNNNTIKAIPYKKALYYNLPNLLIEPSFENYNNADKLPIAWSFTSDNSAQASIDASEFDGNYSFSTIVRNATPGYADLSQLFAINGSRYLFNISYKQTGEGNTSMLLQWMNSMGTETGKDQFNLNRSTSWNIFSYENYIPPNTTQGKVILRYQTQKGDSGTVWFDDVQLYSARED